MRIIGLRSLALLPPMMGGCVLGTSGLDAGATGGAGAGQPSVGGAGGGATGGGAGGSAGAAEGGGGQGGIGGAATGGDGGSPAICGNGIREPGEQCDDGNDVVADGCELCVFDCLAAGGQLIAGPCYFTRDVALVWFEAKKLCEQYGGTLAVINGDVELAALVSIATDHWIGANDAGEDGFIEWVTLEPHWIGPTTLDWPWAGGHPKSDEYCVKLKNQNFETKGCGESHGHLICEVPSRLFSAVN